MPGLHKPEMLTYLRMNSNLFLDQGFWKLLLPIPFQKKKMYTLGKQVDKMGIKIKHSSIKAHKFILK